ncbi:MAG: PTS sugar transporter subunit IIA [Erysipelotrichaceae bacterium]|nr:PTS sugar transporter subunit IIA [Erysipelotrichaceae bacterium]
MLIDENLIVLNAECKDKAEVIELIASAFEKAGKLNDRKDYIKAVYDREAQISTNMGDGIGMPHALDKSVKEVGLSFVRLNQPIVWDEETKENPVRIVFGIAVPESGGDTHLRIIAKLARKLIYDEFKEKLFNVKEKEELLSLIQEATEGAIL